MLKRLPSGTGHPANALLGEVNLQKNAKPFVAIVGQRNSGKSTIIRSLTGAPTAKFRGPIADKSSNRTIEVICSSPQELAMSMTELREILARAKKASCNGVVCALQPSTPTEKLSIEEVLRAACAAGFVIHAYVLDPPYSAENSKGDVAVAKLQHVGIKPLRINGQKFAHLNAAKINRRTRITG